MQDFFIKEISEDEFLVYNSKKHIPIKLDKTGKLFFDFIIKNKNNKKKCLQLLDSNKITEFKNFYKSLSKISFFSLEEEYTDKSLLLKNFDSEKKQFYLHLTDRCNLKCTYCYNEKYRKSVKDLELYEWKIIIDKIIKYCKKVTFTGGEILLYKYFSEIIKYIKDKDCSIYLSLISNGCLDYATLNENHTIELLDSLEISCDNITDNNHERKGFNKEVLLKNLKYLNDINMIDKVKIASVVTKGKMRYIREVEKFCQKNNLKHSTTLCIPNDETNIENTPTIKEFKCFKEKSLFVNKNLSDYVYARKLVTCNAASTVFSIDAKGNCFPCQSFHFPEFNLGNLLKMSFKDIYNSHIATMLRVSNDVNYIEKCRECNVKYLCGGGCRANAYQQEGNLFAYPKLMCQYLKTGAIESLTKIMYNE